VLALHALRTASGAVGRNPVLFVVAAAFSLLQIPGFVAQAVSPLLGNLVSLLTTGLFVLVFPFLFAGVVGMADEALGGRTSLGTFVASGRHHYVPVLVAYLLLFGAGVVLALVVSFGALLLGGVAFAAGAGAVAGRTTVLVAVGLLLVGGVVLFALPLFFVQFYGHAIVVDDLGAVAGLKRSVSCVRHNLLAVLGYTVVVGVVGAVFGLFGAVFSLLTSPRLTGAGAGMGGTAPGTTAPPVPVDAPSVGPVIVAGLVVVFVLASGLFGGFFAAYSTAVYRRIRPAAAG
jgi:hypothetical protein